MQYANANCYVCNGSQVILVKEREAAERWSMRDGGLRPAPRPFCDLELCFARACVCVGVEHNTGRRGANR